MRIMGNARILCSGILLLISILISNQAHAQITASPSSGCAPLTGVQFTSPAGTSSATWDFGNSASSNLFDPQATYVDPGTYTVTFTGTVNGSPVQETTTITVYAKPTAKFTVSTDTVGCLPFTVGFVDQSTSTGGATITNWEWVFGDGGVTTGNNNPTHTYTLAGVFDPVLKVTDNNGCVASVTRNDMITASALPSAVISSNPPNPSACNPPLTVTFNANNSQSNAIFGGGLTYDWDFDNGNTSTVVNPPAQTFVNSGTYAVTLEVTDTIGCTATRTLNVPVVGPFANFSIVGVSQDTICKEVFFLDRSVGTVLNWDYGDGTFDTLPYHTYADTGTYDITLTVYAGSCTDDTTISVYVEEPYADFSINPTYACEIPVDVQFTDQSSPNVTNWVWDFDDNNFSSDQNPLHTYTSEAAGLDTSIYDLSYFPTEMDVTLIVTTARFCADTITKVDTLWPISAAFYPDVAKGCAPLEVTLYDSSTFSPNYESIVSHEWIYDDGTSFLGGPNDIAPTHTYTQPGDYYPTLVITSSSGCTDTSFFQHIQVGTPPNPDFSVSPTQVCPGDQVDITDLTPASDSVDTWYYTADNNFMYNCWSEPNPTWSYTSEAGFSDITLTAGYNGCFNTYTLNNAVEILGPVGRFLITNECDAPYDVTLTGDITGADSIYWDFGDGTILATTTNTTPSHTYASSGDYNITLTTVNTTSGCQPFVYSEVVKIRDVQAVLDAEGRVCPADTTRFYGNTSVDVFADCNKGYRWIFGDTTYPRNSSNPYIDHAYTDGGNYTLTLIVRDVNGCKDTATQQIRSYPVDVDFALDTNAGCLPLTINATDLSTSDTTITDWLWSFGDGNTSTQQNVTHTYSNRPDTTFYPLILYVTNEVGCTDSLVKEVTPFIPDSNFFVIGRRTLCVGEATTFRANNLNLDSYSWNFGDGTTSTDSVFVKTYTQAGSYQVSLNVTDGGCSSANIRPNYVFVQDYPEAGFSSTSDTLDALCYPLQVSFTDTSVNPNPGIRTWNLGNNSPILPNQTVGTLYEQPGTYNVSLIISSSFGCRDTVRRTFQVDGPLGDFNLSDTLICKGEDITFNIKDTSNVAAYAWDFGDGVDTTGLSPVTHTYNFNPPGGSTVASLILWSNDSTCAFSVQQEVSITQVIADFDRNDESDQADTVHCIGLSDDFVDQSLNADTWLWDLGDNTTYTTSTVPQHTYSDTGTYIVSLSITDNDAGCTDFIEKTMIVNPLPVVTADGGDTCAGEPIQLVATGGGTYIWEPSTGLNDTSLASPIALPDSSTLYTVTVIDSNGCESSATAQVTVYQEPPSVTWDTLIVIGQEVDLDASFGDAYTYAWSPEQWLSCYNCADPKAQPLEDIEYTLLVADTLGCFEVPSTYSFVVKPETTIDLPTAFTPNGDGKNDRIYVDGWGIKDLLEFKIYNRWGQLVYEGTELEEGWDGKFEGKDQNIDTYTYTATVETWLEGVVLSKTGSFKLLR